MGFFSSNGQYIADVPEHSWQNFPLEQTIVNVRVMAEFPSKAKLLFIKGSRDLSGPKAHF